MFKIYIVRFGDSGEETGPRGRPGERQLARADRTSANGTPHLLLLFSLRRPSQRQPLCGWETSCALPLSGTSLRAPTSRLSWIPDTATSYCVNTNGKDTLATAFCSTKHRPPIWVINQFETSSRPLVWHLKVTCWNEYLSFWYHKSHKTQK